MNNACTPQSGIVAEGNRFALYLQLDVVEGQELSCRSILSGLPTQLDVWSQSEPTENSNWVIAIGAEAWKRVTGVAPPKQLRAFPEIRGIGGDAPSTPTDLFIQLRSDRYDLLHQMGNQLLAIFGESVELREEVRGFRYLDRRDLIGFVDGTENPQGNHRAEVAYVVEDDPDYLGGCYIHIQRYVHNLTNWQRVSVAEQEAIIGRTKADDIEFSKEQKQPTAHIVRTNLKDEDGNSMEILRQSMPYGDLREQGLFFVSCCATPDNFEKQLRSMLQGDEQGHTDKLMKFSRAVSGAAYFAPSVALLNSLANC